MIPETIKLLIDLTLGDGWIGFNGNSIRGRIEHSIKQKEYAEHKAFLLQSADLPITTRAYISTTHKNAGKEYFQINLLTHPDLSAARKWLYNKNRKSIDKALLRQCDERTLAYLFMDDGCAHLSNYNLGRYEKFIYAQSKTHAYRISTNSFSYDEHLLFQDWLLSFGICSTLEKQNKTFRTIICAEQSKDIFRNIIKQFIIPSMQYKISKPHSFKNIPFTQQPRENKDRKRLNEETLSINSDAIVQ